MKRIILASASPNRRMIMDLSGLKYEIVPSEYEEDNHLDMPPAELVKHLALGKAQWVAERHPDAIVIGADSLVFLGDEVMGKPQTREKLIEMITSLSGQVNKQYTGFAIIHGDQIVTGVSEAKVYMREIAPDEITRYAEFPEGLDKAGGYAIQGRASAFISRIEGSYMGIVGLPLSELMVELGAFGV